MHVGKTRTFGSTSKLYIMEVNYLAVLVAALSTLLVGFIWYHPSVFGTIWMRESKLTQDDLKGSMARIFILSIVYAFLIAFFLQFIVIHQIGAYQLIGGDLKVAKPSFDAFMADYGNDFRTFKHGALHGFFAGLMFVMPVIATNALYDRRSFKYILVTGGFWTACLTLMGGIICGWV